MRQPIPKPKRSSFDGLPPNRISAPLKTRASNVFQGLPPAPARRPMAQRRYRNIFQACALTDGATPALDASLSGDRWTPGVFTLSAAGDRTIAVPTNPMPYQRFFIRHFASGGARTLALNTGAGGFAYGTDITGLTQTASGKTDLIGCMYDPTIAKWLVVSYVKGFA